MKNQFIKEQFNKQAENFANWAIGKNQEYIKGYFDFCEITENDKLLDVACGPGEFTVFSSKRIKEAHGVDISDKEIELAEKLANEFKLTNLHFKCSDVEKLPYPDNSFSVVVCKSAVHHFINPDKVLQEMKRCCLPGGKISIQDIVAFDEDYVTDFFNTFDELVDISHNRVLHITEINHLYKELGLEKIKEFSFEVDLSVNEYIGHAVQEPENKEKTDHLLKKGLKDQKIGKYLFMKNGDMYFKRFGYLILGKKVF